MRPLLAAFAIAALPTVLLAQSADLSITISTPGELDPPVTFDWSAGITNNGPDAATSISIAVESNDGNPICSAPLNAFDRLEPGKSLSVFCTQDVSRGPDPIRVAMTVGSATPDPVAANNHAESLIAVNQLPDLRVFADGDASIIDPALPFPLTIRYDNRARVTATGVTVVIDVPANVTIVSVPENCVGAAQHITCSIGTVVPATLPIPNLETIVIPAIAPDDPSGARISVTATIAGDQQDRDPSSNATEGVIPMYRTIYVTTTDDTGAGSLREAIGSASVDCTSDVPCKLGFRIPPAENQQWQTIRPQSPLPIVFAPSLIVDGELETRFFGDTNPDGPEIEISGSTLSFGDGLVVAVQCNSQVRGLTVNGFPGAGLFLAGPHACGDGHLGFLREITRNYLGVDPTGRVAVPNMRGITVDMVEQPNPYSIVETPYTISANVISGNRRSGIFLNRAFATIVFANRIGVAAKTEDRIDNGASGIYVGPPAFGTSIVDNVIEYSHDAAISIAADDVEVIRNSISHNWQGAIDIGLDGPNVEHDPPRPDLSSAHYDAVTNTTIIKGTVTASLRDYFSPILRFYANDAPRSDGFGEGQYFAGELRTTRPGQFTFTATGDLTGKWIAATSTRSSYSGFATIARPEVDRFGFESATSEFSRAVEVTP